MTWLRTRGRRDLDWDGVTAMFPDAADSVVRLRRVIWKQGLPGVLWFTCDALVTIPGPDHDIGAA